MIKPDDMYEGERQAMTELSQELTQLRTGAMRATGLGLAAMSISRPAAGAASLLGQLRRNRCRPAGLGRGRPDG